MIRYKVGNLFSDEGDSLAHCVSADFKMGAGIAKEFRKRFGWDILCQVKKIEAINGIKIGSCLSAQAVTVNNKWIFNLVTKEKYNHKPTLKTMEQALIHMFKDMTILNKKMIAMPKIGCGLDKLKWDDVSKLIMKHQGEIAVIVYTGEER